VAQTKRKRQTKHRGNAAGIVESRGRTGRRPTAAEKSVEAREKAQKREQREQRYDRPPTWRGAFYRALAAAVLMLVVSLFLIKQTVQAIAIFPLVLAMYWPISYYTDMWMYRRRLRKKAAQGGGAR
jgi:Flp pilus assembly protein TadB